jgi:hypothetical protein
MSATGFNYLIRLKTFEKCIASVLLNFQNYKYYLIPKTYTTDLSEG